MSDIVKNKDIGLNYNPLNDSLYHAIIKLDRRRELLFKMRVNSFNAAINDYDTNLIYSNFPPFLNIVMEHFNNGTKKN